MRARTIAPLLVCLLLTAACASTATIRPGACSKADSIAYDSLLMAGAGVDQLHAEAHTAVEMRLSNKVTVTYNAAQAAWHAYHDAACATNPGSLVADATAVVAAVVDALAVFHPIKGAATP